MAQEISTLTDIVNSSPTFTTEAMHPSLTGASTGAKVVMAVGDYWNNPSELRFNIDGQEVTFSSSEIIRLKEMLSNYIKEFYPEDLL